MANDSRTVRVLELQRNGSWGSELFRLKTGYILRFTLAPSLYAKHVVLKTDYPAPGTLYKRDVFRTLEWKYSTQQPHWDPDRYAELDLDLAGPFCFIYKTGNTSALEDGVQGSGFFVVEPKLSYSPDGITCQTYISKLLGPLSEWKQRLQTAVECGYNMIHLTPIQHLGSSRSAYSISNQLRIDSSYLPFNYTNTEEEVTFVSPEGEIKKLKIDSSYVDVRKVMKDMHQKWGILTIVDMVWNHTSFDTPWLMKHPEAGYNLLNSPHLRPAYALDVTLNQFSQGIADGEWKARGISPEITHERDIHRITYHLTNTVLPEARLWEYFCVDVEAIVGEFRSRINHVKGGQPPKKDVHLKVLQDKKYRRLRSRVDLDLALDLFNVNWPGAVCFEDRIYLCCAALREELKRLNQEIKDRVQSQLQRAVNSLAGQIEYFFLNDHGPQKDGVSCQEPLVPVYFTVLGKCEGLQWLETEPERGEFVLANDGWVMDSNPLINFASEDSQVYFQRDLIVWEDSVKLRYGNEPEDSPWLWDQMKRYTQAMAWVFDGLRLPNCHNTPLNVAQALLDAAREVNPQLYVVAELFTGSEERDNRYVNELGINSLIKEALIASTAQKEGEMVHKFGRHPVGGFLSHPTQAVLKLGVAPTMFMDATHDNDPGHMQQRSVYDAIPNAALASVACCASGSCAGYDQLVPHMISVATETRPYPKWGGVGKKPGEVGLDTGIMSAVLELNNFHKDLAKQGFNQIYVNQMTDEIMAVTRHSHSTHESFILMVHTAFHCPDDSVIPTDENPNTHYTQVPPLPIPGKVEEIVLEARLIKHVGKAEKFQPAPDVISGLESHLVDMRKHISPSQSKMCYLSRNEEGNTQEVVFSDFCPGSIIIFKVSLVPAAYNAVKVIRSFLHVGREATSAEGTRMRQQLEEAVGGLDLLDLNYALYRCDAEERDEGRGGGAYSVPNAGVFPYCGLEGIMSMLTTVRKKSDLGHPICDNLRSGDWLADYTVKRLRLNSGTEKLATVLGPLFKELSRIPRYLIPCYFEATVSFIYSMLKERAIDLMGDFITKGSSTVQALALGSVQLCGVCRSAQLPPVRPGEQARASMAAGLPHFSTGFMRCWGRDTFIALHGLLLVTGRYQEAFDHLLSFAACLRHGLIPNLLSGGTNPRYNCRDAPWWWLQSVQEYWKLAPNGRSILQAEVRKIFRDDESQADFSSKDTVPLSEIIQEILQRHASGTQFHERGAGPNLDCNMTEPGFDVHYGVDEKTGFVYGGNEHNAGTWMDKVGESTQGGNRGSPATPRDGSAVELVGLCYSTVTWLSQLHKEKVYPYQGVTLPSSGTQKPESGMRHRHFSDFSWKRLIEKFVPAIGRINPHKERGYCEDTTTLTYDKWSSLIKDNFESNFWIPTDPTAASERAGLESRYIHHYGIYRDCLGSTTVYANFQLRPNFPIAMVVAPELFTPENAWTALVMAEKLLLGPLGMRTLDPKDIAYRGNYSTSDGYEKETAKGFNFHQGPEWLWVLGYFLRARLQCAGEKVEETLSFIHRVLSAHAQAVRDSPWKGLPELTNKDGMECIDSCPVQAWSMATLLDVLYDLQQYCRDEGQ